MELLMHKAEAIAAFIASPVLLDNFLNSQQDQWQTHRLECHLVRPDMEPKDSSKLELGLGHRKSPNHSNEVPSSSGTAKDPVTEQFVCIEASRAATSHGNPQYSAAYKETCSDKNGRQLSIEVLPRDGESREACLKRITCDWHSLQRKVAKRCANPLWG